MILDHLVLDEQAAWPSQKVRTRFGNALLQVRQEVYDLLDEADGAVLLLSDLVAGENDAPTERRAEEMALLSQARGALQGAQQEGRRGSHKDLCALVAVFAENEPVLSPGRARHLAALRGGPSLRPARRRRRPTGPTRMRHGTPAVVAWARWRATCRSTGSYRC